MYKHELVKQKKQLQAMQLLLEWYEGSNNICDSICPLCRAIEKHTCKGCVWIVCTGKPCNMQTGISIDISQSRNKRYSKWVERRIPELNEWIKHYSEEK